MGSMKLILGIFTIVAVVYLVAELAPPFFANYQFEDVIKTQAQMEALLDHIEGQYGSVSAYVEGLGAAPGLVDRLRSALLEPRA